MNRVLLPCLIAILGLAPASAHAATGFTAPGNAVPGYDASVQPQAADRTDALATVIGEFYRRAGRQLGIRFAAPAMRPGTPCNGVAPDRNMVYCAAGGFVTWDDPGFMRPVSRWVGTTGVSVVIARAWG